MKLSMCDEFIWKCTRIKWLLLRLKQNLWKRKKQISKTENNKKKSIYQACMFLTQKTFYFFTNYHLVFFRSTWLVAHGRRNAYQQTFWRSFNCFLNVAMVIFHIWFNSKKVEQEKKYLVHLSLLRELMTS